MPVSQPLIVGAGPVGLAAAVFLSRQGLAPRIIDSSPQPSNNSRALAVNPRTLELLESAGITEKMLAIGKKIHGGCLWRNDKTIAEFSLNDFPHKYPFMLALSQATTQRLLEADLNIHGIHVERNTALAHCRDQHGRAEADIKLPDDSLQTTQIPWMLAADGARSTARQELSIPFSGSTFENHWHLMDVTLSTSLPEDRAHIIFTDDGFLFMLRVVDETEKMRTGDPLWRLIANFPDLLQRLEMAKPTAEPSWKSEFRISHRINDRLQQGQVYFAGDAAHIHSPMGARGMNLGIEDAWVLTQLLHQNRLTEYGALRRKIDRQVVKRVELFSRIVAGESFLTRTLRRIFPKLIRFGAIRRRMLLTVTGLDHALTV